MKIRLTTLSLLLMAGGAWADGGPTARSLFFGEDQSVVTASVMQKDKPAAQPAASPDAAPGKPLVVATKKPAKPKYIGASYFIRLKNPDGTTRDVLASRKFKSGDRFQLGVKVNRPSYVYILNQDPSGNVTQLYPEPGKDSRVEGMGVVFLPKKGAFEFDSQPGTEHLLVYLSQSPLKKKATDLVKSTKPDVVSSSDTALAACGTGNASGERLALASAAPQTATTRGIVVTEDPPCDKPAAKGAIGRGIILGDDPAPGPDGQVASYVVKASPKPSSSLFLKIELDHQ